jgi:hypothetical protein
MEIDVSSFEKIPGRVFLDTCVVNLALDYGEQLHDGIPVPEGLAPRLTRDIEALCGIFDTGQRAFWQFAISPYTYREVTTTTDPSRCYELERWFFEIWHYWREFFHSADDLPSFTEAEETRLSLLASGVLDILPDIADRLLICDAVVYNCDAFCTRDWRTILKHRGSLKDLPLRIITPDEWWSEIKPWAAVWL